MILGEVRICVETVKSILGRIDGGRILDVATGDGAFIDLLTGNLKSYDTIVGIDTDVEAIEASAAQKANAKVSYRRMSGEAIDYPDGCFDTVSLSNSLHHLANIDRTIAEMLRVLRKGGTIIINELYIDGQNEKQMTHMLFHHFQADIDTLLGITHGKTFHKREILDIVERSGIRDYVTVEHENEAYNTYVNFDGVAQRYKNFLDKIAGYPEYDAMKARYDSLLERLRTVGIAFTSQLMVVAKKSDCL